MFVLPHRHCVFPDERRERREEKTKNGEEIDENALVSPVSSPFFLPRLVFLFFPAVSVSFLRGRRQRGANFQVPQGALSPFFVYLHDHVAPRRPVLAL